MYRFAINRPITVIMMMLSLVVFGILSFRSMPIDLFPNIDFPVVTVQTNYFGADGESVESKVTDKIEEAISGIDGIDKITSMSFEGLSVVTIQFKLTKDLNEAVSDVRDKIGSLYLPNEVEKPLVKKLSTSGAVINLFVASKSNDFNALMQLTDQKLKPRLQKILGVGEVDIVGYRDREIRIFLDPFLLNKYGLDSKHIEQIIAAQNLRAGGGKLIGADKEIILKSIGDASSIEELKNITILEGVRLGDIAIVKDGLSDPSSFSTFEGNIGVNMEIKKISGKNTLEIIESVKKILPELRGLAGEDFTIEPIQDRSLKILQNIDNVLFDLIYGSILAIIIVFAFLRNLSATLISALAIPTSIIGTFAIIDWLGYDLNRLTLIGLTLAIGIFIDDAIVVIENISKKLESGMESFRGAFEGIKEIAFSILAISMVLLAVFVPVAFMDGIVGRFFNSFAITVASGVVISFFVAVMLVPTIGARVLNHKESHLFKTTEPFFVKLDQTYVHILRFLLRFKFLSLASIFLLLLGSGFLAKYIGGDFVPMEDNSEFQILIDAKDGTSLEKMKEIVKPILEELDKDEMIEAKILSIGYNTAKEKHKARIYCKLVSVENRIQRQEEIVQNYREKIASLGIKDISISIQEVPPFDTGESAAPIQIVITGPKLEEINEISKGVIKILEGVSGVVNIETDYKAKRPEIRISIARESAMRLGVSGSDIANAFSSAFSSDSAISSFEENGKQFDITVRFSDEHRERVEDIKKMYIKNRDGNLIPLEGLIELKESEGVSSIGRFNRERKILITANLYEQTPDVVVKAIEENIDSLLKDGYSYRFVGDIERMAETNAAFGAAVLLAVLLIYFILAGLYESLLQPFIIMLSMPLSFMGVILALFLSGKPFSLFVMIGIILLLGMVGKNGILVVDFANRAIKDGKNVEDALLEAGEKRLRPILMTTLAMIFAMFPLAFGTGAGAEGNSPMALAIIGGLISSTLLTLLAVPIFYRIIYPIDARIRKFYEREEIN